MTLQELADKEDGLHNKVIDLYHRHESYESNKLLQDIFLEYKKIHEAYAELSSTDLEALKRGLFIQWYALAEPSYLTGISELSQNAENKVIEHLYEVIAASKADNELIWMLNYYAKWDWIFGRLKSFKGFDSETVNERNSLLPDKIDKEEMEQRGQMGEYWNSVTRYSNT